MTFQEHCVIFGTQDDGIFEQDGQRIKLVHWEVEHDPFGHERVSMIAFSGKDWEPDPHAMSTAIEPETRSQVGLVSIRLPRKPNCLTARSKYGG